IERMRHQAAVQGPEALSRAGDIISRGLSAMTGAVSFRLMLALLVARLLLPAASGEEGYGARMDRIERRLPGAAGSGAPAAPAPAAAPAPSVAQQGRSQAPPAAQPQPQPQPAQARPQPAAQAPAQSQPGEPSPAADHRPEAEAEGRPGIRTR